MKIQPSGWEFAPTTEFCCYAFKMDTMDDYIHSATIFTNGKDVFFGMKKISHCPYCGKEIVLEKVIPK